MVEEEDFEVKVLGFYSHREAEEFSVWYSERGEQDFSFWLEEQHDVGLQAADVKLTRSKSNGIDMTIDPMY